MPREEKFDLEDGLKHYSGDERKALFYMAQTAERAERYDDMVMFISELVRITGGKGLTAEERASLTIAFKKVIGPVRSAYSATKTSGPKFESLNADYNKHLKKEITQYCTNALGVFENVLVRNNDSSVPEAQVYYLKMTADYYRYLAELGEKSMAAKAESFYKQAMSLAESGLPPTHPERLGVALNYSVYLHSLVQDPKHACSLAKNAFDKAITKLDDLDEAAYKDSTLIMQLLRDNLTLWTSDRRGGSKK